MDARIRQSCPSWARTRTLLIQSQACCQLHQGAVLRFFFADSAAILNVKPPPLRFNPLRHPTFLNARLQKAIEKLARSSPKRKAWFPALPQILSFFAG